jgi:hypothetical protein
VSRIRLLGETESHFRASALSTGKMSKPVAAETGSCEMIVGNYSVTANPDAGTLQVSLRREVRFPSVLVGVLSYAVAALRGLGPRAKFVGIGAFAGAATMNHIIDICKKDDSIVFDAGTAGSSLARAAKKGEWKEQKDGVWSWNSRK